MDDAKDPVHGLFVDRQAAMTPAHHGFGHHLEGGVGLDSGHVQPGHHDLPDGGGVKTNYGTEHLTVPVIQAGQFFFGDGRLFRLGRRGAIGLAAMSNAWLAVDRQCRPARSFAIGRSEPGPGPGQSGITINQGLCHTVDQEKRRQ